MKRTNKGFTLIELMIVVAIIGILAAIAIPNFLRFQLKSKTSEGKVNLAAIRTAEESFNAEFGSYVTSAARPVVAALGTTKVEWDETDPDGFGAIGWAPEGPTFFEYAVTAVAATGALPARYTASARADIDGDGVPQSWGYAKDDTNVPATRVAGVNCDVTELPASNQVAPCDALGNAFFGNSVF